MAASDDTSKVQSYNTWLAAKADSSQKQYSAWTNDYLQWEKNDNNFSLSQAQRVQNYFQDCHDHGYATSTLWSGASAIKQYLDIVRGFSFDREAKLTISMFQQWQKKEDTKKSAVCMRS